MWKKVTKEVEYKETDRTVKREMTAKTTEQTKNLIKEAED